MSDEDYRKAHGIDSQGVTLKHKQEVHLNKKHFTKKLVGHELFHAYHASCCTSSTDNIDSEDTEEIGAEIIEFHLDEMVTNRNKIYRGLGGR